jgi:hypothetical protein
MSRTEFDIRGLIMKQDKDKGKQLIRNSTAEFLIFTGNAGDAIELGYDIGNELLEVLPVGIGDVRRISGLHI